MEKEKQVLLVCSDYVEAADSVKGRVDARLKMSHAHPGAVTLVRSVREGIGSLRRDKDGYGALLVHDRVALDGNLVSGPEAIQKMLGDFMLNSRLRIATALLDDDTPWPIDNPSKGLKVRALRKLLREGNLQGVIDGRTLDSLPGFVHLALKHPDLASQLGSDMINGQGNITDGNVCAAFPDTLTFGHPNQERDEDACAVQIATQKNARRILKGR